jgi:hypothetical protein
MENGPLKNATPKQIITRDFLRTVKLEENKENTLPCTYQQSH